VQPQEIPTATPTVSIGMPVYNGEKYIRESLDSLLSQTFTEFELLISDNASTDGTEAICREYAARDSRIRYVRQNENRGAAANFELVLYKAQGEYFMWMACDDIAGSPSYLGCLVDVITKGNYDLALPAVDIIFTATDGTSQYFRRNSMDGFSECKTVEDYCVATVRWPVFHIYGLFRRRSLLENMRYVQRAEQVIGAFHDGLLGNAVSANLLLCYVPAARKIYRYHSEGGYTTAYTPPEYLARSLKYYRVCVQFWLTESKVPLKTKARVMSAIAYGTAAVLLITR